MKKIFACILMGLASASAFAGDFSETKCLANFPYHALSNTAADGRFLTGGYVLSGNYYYLGASYIVASIAEMDISSYNLQKVDSFEIKFSSIRPSNEYSTNPDLDADVLNIVFYDASSATGNVRSDYATVFADTNKVYSSELFSLNDLTAGVTLNVNMDVLDSDYLAFAFVANQTAMPIKESDGLGFRVDGSAIELTVNGTTVPEPSTYAAIFGALALGIAAWRRRK